MQKLQQMMEMRGLRRSAAPWDQSSDVTMPLAVRAMSGADQSLVFLEKLHVLFGL